MKYNVYNNDNTTYYKKYFDCQYIDCELHTSEYPKTVKVKDVDFNFNIIFLSSICLSCNSRFKYFKFFK
jgi:hypothetical protein